MALLLIFAAKRQVMATNRIREIMSTKGITAEELSSRIPSSRTESGHISVSALNQHITGNPSVDVLEKISLALDVPIWQLFISPEDAAGEDSSDFCAFIRWKGIHYTADTEDEFWRIVEELRTMAGRQ